MKTDKKILDACCGSRMMWFDKCCSEDLFMDIRREELIACDGRHIKVDPDIVGDFRAMPFDDESFRLVVLDPPHLRKIRRHVMVGSEIRNASSFLGNGYTCCFR